MPFVNGFRDDNLAASLVLRGADCPSDLPASLFRRKGSAAATIGHDAVGRLDPAAKVIAVSAACTFIFKSPDGRVTLPHITGSELVVSYSFRPEGRAYGTLLSLKY